MRICFICQEDIVRPQGGTGTYVRNISTALASRGHDVHVITRKYDDAPQEVVERVTIHRVSAPGAGMLYNPLYFSASRRKFEELHAIKPFDVIHGNLPTMSSFGIRNKKGLPPVVETVHCTVKEEVRSLADQSLDKLSPNELLSRMLAPIWAKRERYLLARANQVISVSKGLKREIVSQYGYSAEQVSVVPNGIDCARFKPTAESKAKSAELKASLGIDPDDHVILYIGRLTERKRAIDLVRAMPSIVRKVPNARLVIVGKRTTHADRLQVLAAELGVHDRLIMIDHVPYAQVGLYYGMADVYCLPSSYEGFPFTVLEAMASGTPVVASNIDGINEQIEHGKNGLLHDVGNVEEMATYICRIMNNPTIAQQISKAASEHVQRNFDWAAIGEQTERIFTTAAFATEYSGRAISQWA